MKKTNSQKGITLVALIVTIIVLLILAVVAIRAVQGDNIIAHAENARDKYNQAQRNEQVELNEYTGKIEQSLTTTSISEAQSDTMLTKTTNTITYDIYGNKIVVPAGFKILVDATTGYTEKDINLTKGIVIQDKDGNEFVWVPVGKIKHLDKDGKETTTTIDLKRYVFKDYGGKINESLSQTEPSAQLKINSQTTVYFTEGLKNSNTSNAHAKDIEEFILSVVKNGGYYIARFEAGITGYDVNNIPTSGNNTSTEINWTGYTSAKGENLTLVSKSGEKVWDYVTQKKASELSRNMYTNKPFESDLINSYAWDTAILFIQTFSTKSDASTYSRLNKSTSFANTGINPDKYCNIHDMSGNVSEFSTETYSTSTHTNVLRGGYFSSQSNVGMSYTDSRTGYLNNLASNRASFRPIIYLQK